MYLVKHQISTLALLGAATLALTLVAGCGSDQPPPQREEVLRPVRYVVVTPPSDGRERTFSGTSRAGQEAQLSFKVGGTIKMIPVKLGDRLKPGQVIARLDQAKLELELQKASAALAQAKAEQRNAGANYKRVRNLYENNNASRNDLDGARAAAESAQAQVRSMAKSLELAQLNLSYATLKAGEACSVATVQAEVNENVSAGQDVVSVTCGESNEVAVLVPEGLIAEVRVGMRAGIRFSSIDAVGFSGRVTEVSVASEGGAAFPVTLQILESHPSLRSGLAAEVTLRFTANNGAAGNIHVPAVAVGQDAVGRYVFVVEETDQPNVGVISRRTVQVGELTQDGLVLLDGVAPGDRVVTAGVSIIRDGLRVKVD